jgi:hypothetical protein
MTAGTGPVTQRLVDFALSLDPARLPAWWSRRQRSA